MAAARRGIRPILAVMVAAAALAGLGPSLLNPPASVPVGAPCYNGVFPLNPYVDNCALTPRPPRTLGSAPDQNAILNCGNGGFRAQCLSLYVNGGYGWYPGAVLVPGYHP